MELLQYQFKNVPMKRQALSSQVFLCGLSNKGILQSDIFHYKLHDKMHVNILN